MKEPLSNNIPLHVRVEQQTFCSDAYIQKYSGLVAETPSYLHPVLQEYLDLGVQYAANRIHAFGAVRSSGIMEDTQRKRLVLQALEQDSSEVADAVVLKTKVRVTNDDLVRLLMRWEPAQDPFGIDFLRKTVQVEETWLKRERDDAAQTYLVDAGEMVWRSEIHLYGEELAINNYAELLEV